MLRSRSKHNVMPAKAGIQYAEAVVMSRDAGGYWIAPSSRATTGVVGVTARQNL
ncbi:hypothetical protein [Bradyrhizobium oligotrophicum]|nr:hypothetical protein [Bradyrhizobium oligotrophicum]